jgi:adenylate kinase family enzyme
MYFVLFKNDTELGKQARVYMDAGDLVPDELQKCLLMRVNKHQTLMEFYLTDIHEQLLKLRH